MRNGYTLAEMLIVMGIVVILALVSLTSFVNRRNQTQLSSTTSMIGGLLREAQSNSRNQASSTSWGVHFENGTRPFFALFAMPYSSSSHFGYYPLPAWVGYATSSVASGSIAEVTFAQLSGARSGSSSISIYLIESDPEVSSTIIISGAGSVSY